MTLAKPLTVPEAVSTTAEVVARLDGCFTVGFGRLGPEQTEALQSVSRIFAGTPPGATVAGAVEAIARNEFVDKHFATLAVARAALQGAQYDALRAHVWEALERGVPNFDDPLPAQPSSEGPVAVWQESTRNWLMELAISGFSRLEYETLAPFSATLEQLQDERTATRLAAILTGFQNELLQSIPISAMPEVPIFRWVDLWTRSMVAALRTPNSASDTKVSGTFSPLGVDLRSHGYMVSGDIYGRLDINKESQIVRATISGYKVDVVTGSEIWRAFDESLKPVIDAISIPAGLEITDCTLLDSGDLIFDGKFKKGKAIDLFKLASETLSNEIDTPKLSAADRHPLHLAELVYMEEYSVDKEGNVVMGEVSLPVAVKRIHSSSELQADHLKDGDQMVGLLRFDGGAWSIQPLAIKQRAKKNSEIFTGQDAAASFTAPKKGDTLSQLEERASRLLREKA